MSSTTLKLGGSPLVVCVTNTVAANFTANCLLAIGAKPAMMEEPCEAEELAAQAGALLVNVGTVTAAQAETMRAAIIGAKSAGVPWVLDPVAVQALTYRRGLAEELLKLGPAVVRGNHGEIGSLGLSGVVSLSTGEVDVVTGPDGKREEMRGGVPMLQSVTATGCAQGALCAAYLAGGMTPLDAARTVSRLMKRAGERAAARAGSPGSFQIALLDSLWDLTHEKD